MGVPIFFLSWVALTYLVTSALCLFISPTTSSKSVGYIITTLLFCVVLCAGTSAGFMYKDKWLGVNIYFVPSMSMYPALKPGQFILVDTWLYQQKEPKLEDVVVFNHGVNNQYLVKRITPWPTHQTVKQDYWFATGDNPPHSQDSRYFGAIKTEQLKGKVTMVLAEFDKENTIGLGIKLTKVI